MPARLRFEEGRVVGSAGCNRLMGTYTTQGETIRFEPRMASTMMACPEPLMTQERETGAALAAAAAFRLDGKLLELQDKEGKPLLRLIVEEPSPLTDRTWRLAGYNNGRQAIVSALAGTEITLELRDDGTLGGSNGCNRYMSGYTLEGERLTIGPLATTRMACKGPKGAEQQAADYAAALETVAGFRIEADTLTLTKGDGTPAARFQVQAPPPPQSPVVESPAIEPPAVEAGAEGGTGTTPAAR
jgi:heat shock protein HslJ